MVDNYLQADLDVLVECAIHAPSVHNTQPWRFERRGVDGLDVFAVRDRQLGWLDPTGRQLHISCGAAVEFAYLGGRSLGRDCEVKLLPDIANSELLARLTLGAARPAADEENRLADAIAIRYTDRGPYDERPVPVEILARARRRAAELDVWLRPLDHRDDRRAVTLALAAAEAAETADPGYAEELAQWTHAGRTDDGIPDRATPAWPAGVVSDVPLRDFTGANRHPHPEDYPNLAPTVERDTLLAIGSEGDDPQSWLAAGRALGWTLLRAAVEGVSAQPLGQAIDLLHARQRLGHELGLVGHLQFLLRMGYGAGAPTTGRQASRPAP